jgi:hypothetical protein
MLPKVGRDVHGRNTLGRRASGIRRLRARHQLHRPSSDETWCCDFRHLQLITLPRIDIILPCQTRLPQLQILPSLTAVETLQHSIANMHHQRQNRRNASQLITALGFLICSGMWVLLRSTVLRYLCAAWLKPEQERFRRECRAA